MRSSVRCLLATWLVLGAGSARAVDLTGLWQDDSGGGATYRVRQIDNWVYWVVDGTPQGSHVNLAYGTISGDTLSLTWQDMPVSPTLSGGSLTLTIASNDRLVKVTSSTHYGASAWTRAGSGPGSGTPPPPPPTAGQVIAWGDAAAKPFRGQNGKRITFTCPLPSATGSVWGTDVYTDDSLVCVAAVHAGLITYESGGTVTVEIRPGADSYAGSQRNGVRTESYGPWHGSMVFVGGGSGVVGLTQRRAAPPPAAADAPVWQYQSGGDWHGTWTRRGTSDLYDSRATGPGGRSFTTLEQVRFEGRLVHAQRIESSDGAWCTLDGTLHPDGRTYVGTATCSGGVPTGWIWRITPAGMPFPPW